MSKANKKTLSPQQQTTLLKILEQRFENNQHRHTGIKWAEVQAKLEGNSEAVWSLNEMENTGGEPDVIGYDKAASTYTFVDCAKESPTGRRSICYDREGLESRKEHKPQNNAVDMATAMGIELLSEEDYRHLQHFETVDAKTSSWIKTPADVRKLGGALFADFRFGRVFIYHNGAQSYYGGRGFRGLLKV